MPEANECAAKVEDLEQVGEDIEALFEKRERLRAEVDECDRKRRDALRKAYAAMPRRPWHWSVKIGAWFGLSGVYGLAFGLLFFFVGWFTPTSTTVRAAPTNCYEAVKAAQESPGTSWWGQLTPEQQSALAKAVKADEKGKTNGTDD